MEADQELERWVRKNISISGVMDAEIESIARDIGEMESVLIRILLREALDARRQSNRQESLVGSAA